MIYFSAWIILVILSLWAALAAFIWALQNGQFSDQDRARFLPLNDDLPLTTAKDPPKNRAQAIALTIVLALGLVTILATIFMSLLRLKG